MSTCWSMVDSFREHIDGFKASSRRGFLDSAVTYRGGHTARNPIFAGIGILWQKIANG